MGPIEETLRQTPLYALHRELGAKFVPFAGYDMPVQYPTGVLAEHRHTRSEAGLFDVSHMGQLRLTGTDVIDAIEALVPGDIASLGLGRIRYTLLTRPDGGIIDDLMVTRNAAGLGLVVNAATKANDIAHLEAHLKGRVRIEILEDFALLALQGPAAAAVLARFVPEIVALPFMAARDIRLGGATVQASRCGYTGEDGFELSIPAASASSVAALLLEQPEVAPIGLGARDSLRLEAGLSLYGHDIDISTTPIEAGLAWIISKRRRAEGGFPGAAIIQRQLTEGTSRRLVGIIPDGKAPAREGTEIWVGDMLVGKITSGGFGPTKGGPIALGYVASAHSAVGSPIDLLVRGTRHAARIVTLPFVPHRYFRA
jgi:aminomethyltransferase